jgi:hypothetical protein
MRTGIGDPAAANFNAEFQAALKHRMIPSGNAAQPIFLIETKSTRSNDNLLTTTLCTLTNLHPYRTFGAVRKYFCPSRQWKEQ